MAATTTLYAWAVPAIFEGSPLDHTWVTTYDNRTTVYQDEIAVGKAGEDYWFCWGDFHEKGGTPVDPTGFLGSAIGSRGFAKCLVESNADSRSVPAARGTIFRYGLDGVCHQLANQVLFVTARVGVPPLLVRHARGYGLSTSIYGDYGLQTRAWKKQLLHCGHGRATIATLSKERLTKTMDDFEYRARAVLSGPDDKQLLADLLGLRKQFQAELRAARDEKHKSAQELNARNQAFFDRVAKLLGAQRYEALFGVAPDTRVNLVDPHILEGIKENRGR